MTDDLVALGCGWVIGHIIFWGILIVPAILWMHPWILLVGFGIWWLLSTSAANEAAPGGGPAPTATAEPHGPIVKAPNETPPTMGSANRRAAGAVPLPFGLQRKTARYDA
jgi:hypothetical protein